MLSERTAQVDPEVGTLSGVRALELCDSTGACTYVLEAGADNGSGKPPLLLVHGLGQQGMRDFYPILEELARTRRVIAIDLAGLGRSTLGERAPTPHEFAACIGSVLAELVDGPFDLLGHSLGGVPVLLVAAAHRTRVRHLVLVDVAGVLHREAFVGSEISGGLATVQGISPRAAQIVTGAGKAVTSALRNFEPSDALLRFGARHLAGAQAQAAMALIQMDVGPVLERVTAPTLLLWGSRDTIAPMRTAQILEQRIASSRLVVLEGVGHVPMTERPKEMASSVLSFLDTTVQAHETAQSSTRGSSDYVCDGKSDLIVRGNYRRVSLRNCHRILLERVNAERLEAEDSDGEIIQSSFTRGIHADHSDLVLTAGKVEGEVALRLDESRIDVAGTRLRGTQAAVMAVDDSRVLFSVTDVESPYTRGSLHGHVGLEDGEGL